MKLAIEGTIVMSDELRMTLDNMYDARLPEKWAKLSWQSTTLGFWYTELLERDGQFRRWCYHGRPKVCLKQEIRLCGTGVELVCVFFVPRGRPRNRNFEKCVIYFFNFTS